MRQPLDWVYRWVGLFMIWLSILTFWAASQRPMFEYEELAVYVFIFQISVLMCLGMLSFIVPTIMSRVRRYVENILMEEYE